MKPFFAYLSRLKFIRRWGLMRSALPENDAEHTLQTAILAHGLAVIRQKVFHEPCDERQCVMLAIYHDASEVFTGDLPTPVKYFNSKLHGEYEKIENMARERLLDTLPEAMQPAYRPYIVDMEKDPVWPLVKAADTLSAFLKCAEEKQAGNPEFNEAYEQIEDKLRQMHLKEVDWFMEHFAGSFQMTLDQLNKAESEE
jgi:5'-deoxynucleotidase